MPTQCIKNGGNYNVPCLMDVGDGLGYNVRMPTGIFKRTKEHNRNLALGRMAENNPNWKGRRVGLGSLHSWVKSRLPKPNKCNDCRLEKRLDLANVSQKYKRDLKDWEWLCRKCHMSKDGRLNNFIRNGYRMPIGSHHKKKTIKLLKEIAVNRTRNKIGRFSLA